MKVWQISCDVKNNRDGGNHEVDENDDNIKFISSIYLSVYLSIYLSIYLHLLFIYLFIISFKLLKLRWIYSAKREYLDR